MGRMCASALTIEDLTALQPQKDLVDRGKRANAIASAMAQFSHSDVFSVHADTVAHYEKASHYE